MKSVNIMTGNKIYIYIHAIWATKNHEPILAKNIRTLMFKYIKEDSEAKGMQVVIVNGIEDHVHCLFKMLATQNVADILKQIKGGSSHWLNEMKFLKEPFQWQDGYAAYSVSPSGVEKVVDYIFKQEQHHASKTFEQEMEALNAIDKIAHSG